MKVKLFFAWYDMWIGAYWSKEKKTLYICLLPTIVISIRKKIKLRDGPWNLKTTDSR